MKTDAMGLAVIIGYVNNVGRRLQHQWLDETGRQRMVRNLTISSRHGSCLGRSSPAPRTRETLLKVSVDGSRLIASPHAAPDWPVYVTNYSLGVLVMFTLRSPLYYRVITQG